MVLYGRSAVATTSGVGVIEATLPRRKAAPGQGTGLRRALRLTAIASVAATGVLLRLWILGRQPPTSSTEIPALMAHQILHGHFYAFYWGQSYGGVEPYVVAAMFGVFGQSSLTLGLTPVLLDAISAMLIWRIGRRLFGPGVGVGAALLFWIWPEVYVFNSTMEYGFRYVTLVCGLAVMLLAIRICQRDEALRTAPMRPFTPITYTMRSTFARRLDWFALGLLAGLGWWGSPEIVYYAAPAGVFLGWRIAKRRADFRLEHLGIAATAAATGALPWIWSNARTHLGSFRHVPHGQAAGSYGSHLSTFFAHILPMSIGLRLRADYVTGKEAWVPRSGGFLVGTAGPLWVTVVGAVLYGAALVALLAWTITLAHRRSALPVAGATLAFPFVYAISPFASDWNDGRYGLFIAPLLALLVASGAYAGFTLYRRATPALALSVVAGLGLTVTAVVQLSPYTSLRGDAARSSLFSWSADPGHEASYLAKSLESAHLHRLWAGYYVSWAVDWESDGQVTASDVRYPNATYYSSVRGADNPAWLFVEPSQLQRVAFLLDMDPRVLQPGCEIDEGSLCVEPGAFEAFLAGRHIGYRVLHFGPFLAVKPSKGIPESVLKAFRSSLPTSVILR